MKPKILSKRVLLIAIPLLVILFVALILSFVAKNLIQSDSVLLVENVVTLPNQEQTNQAQKSVGLPINLKIPIIGVDADVIPVGLTPDGAMDVPNGPVEVAWFNLGPRPGENGSAVIAGHYGWKNNLPAVFDNLHKLHKGDKIYIEDEKGVNTAFVVREIQIYNKDEDASDVFYSSDEKAHLNLVTCTGVWNNVEKTRSDRLIVFTDKE